MCIILLCGVQIANIWLGRSITEVTYIIIIAQHTAQPTCYVGQRENGKSMNIELVTNNMETGSQLLVWLYMHRSHRSHCSHCSAVAIEYRRWLLDTHPQMNRVNSVPKYEDVTILLLCLYVRCGPIVQVGVRHCKSWRKLEIKKIAPQLPFFCDSYIVDRNIWNQLV